MIHWACASPPSTPRIPGHLESYQSLTKVATCRGHSGIRYNRWRSGRDPNRPCHGTCWGKRVCAGQITRRCSPRKLRRFPATAATQSTTCPRSGIGNVPGLSSLMESVPVMRRKGQAVTGRGCWEHGQGHGLCLLDAMSSRGVALPGERLAI